MIEERDKIVSTNPDYQMFEQWSSLEPRDGHEVLQKAAESCLKFNTTFGRRFTQLKSTDLVAQRHEKRWLLDLIDIWFFKRWNNKKIADLHKQSPKKRGHTETCDQCKTSLVHVCPNLECCDSPMHIVRPPFWHVY